MLRAKNPISLLATGLFAAALCLAAPASAAGPLGAYTTKGAYSFVSEPNLHPPKLRTDTRTQTSQLAAGYFLTANFPNVTLGKPLTGQGGPLILDNNLQPVWFDPAPTDVVATDLKQQTFQGKPALSWWEGVVNNVGATVSGSVIVVDQHYRTVGKLTGDLKDGWVISPHEVVISGANAWVTSYKYLPNQDFSAYQGPASGTLYDFAVQEYNLKTGQLLYTWDAFNPGGTPNVSLSQSNATPPAKPGVPWDAYHGNSVQLVGTDKFLVSMRNTNAAYLVNIKTGKVEWTLGGKDSTFTLPANAQFSFQHHVQLLANNEVVLYDDHCCAIVGPGKFAPPTGPSRGLVLKLDLTKHTATLVHQYTHGANFDAAFTGSTELLSNGNVLVGWGSQPYFSEFTKSGKLILDAVWPGVDLSYRVLFTSNWVGTPFFPPSGAVHKAKHGATVYASWDGATQVVSWRVLAGPSSKHLATVATKAKSSFETAISLPQSYKAYKVQALDSKGHVLGTSGLFPKPAGPGPPGFY
jgi:hypothetical protein